MTENGLRAFFTLLSGLVALYSYNYLTGINVGILFSIILSAVMAAVIYKVLEFCLLEYPMRFSFFRRRIDKRSCIEGVWEQVIADLIGHRLSIAHIYFDHIEKKYIFRGSNYRRNNSNGGVVKLASWKSRWAEIDLKEETMEFSYLARIIRSDQEPSYTVGQGIIRFEINGEFCDEGIGHFNDDTTGQKNFRFEIRRIQESEIYELIGRKGKMRRGDWSKLAEKLYEKRDSDKKKL